MTRNEVIAEIKASLKRRSGKAWSVTGGRGTAYGWITIDAPPARRTANMAGDGPARIAGCGYTSLAERAELAELLGLEMPTHCQGHSVPASNDYYREYIDRSAGKKPSVIAKPYWD